MKIELKNVKYSKFASHETSCYEATLYVNGERVGIVSNDGQGGCDNFHATSKAGQELFVKADDWCKENLPKWDMAKYGGDTTPRDTDLEMHCGKLLDDYLLKKEVKAKLRTTVLIEAKDGNIYGYKIKHRRPEKIIEYAAAQPDTVRVLNSMPFDEAVKVYAEKATV